MEHGDHAISESAIRRVRILGWLTIALGVAPYIVILPLVMSVTTSPSQGPGAFLDGIAYVLALVVAPVTLLICLMARGLFRFRPWARWLTLTLTGIGMVLILLLGGVIAVATFTQKTASQREFVELYHEIDPETGQLLTKERRRAEIIDPRELRLRMRRVAVLCVLLLALLSYCGLAQLWLWRPSVRRLFLSSNNLNCSGVKSA